MEASVVLIVATLGFHVDELVTCPTSSVYLKAGRCIDLKKDIVIL